MLRRSCEGIVGAGILFRQVLDAVTCLAVLHGNKSDAIERQLLKIQLGVLDVLFRDLFEAPFTCITIALAHHAPQAVLTLHILAVQHHETLGAGTVDATVQNSPALDSTRTHPHQPRFARTIGCDERWKPQGVLLRPGVEVQGLHEHTLEEDQPLAIVIRPGLCPGVWPWLAGHGGIDRLVDIALDDQEPGHAAGNLVVRRAMGMRVIPVCAGRVRHRFAITLEGELQFVVELTDVLVVFGLVQACIV